LQSPLGIIIITIIAAVGGLISHLLQRRSQHRIWLREHRITAFAEFIKTFDECVTNKYEYIKAELIKDSDAILNHKVSSQRLREIFDPGMTHLRVVSLLLDKESRIKFHTLVLLKIHRHCEPWEGNVESLINLDEQIQGMLEKQLEYPDFVTILKRPFRKFLF
jgi:hypothetical protein